ncbi:MAG: hypothetical protein ACERK6_13650 [Candidatus Aminicenantaceae bacterium]
MAKSAKKISVLGLSVLIVSTLAPVTSEAAQEKDTIDNRVIVLEAFIVEADGPLLLASINTVKKAAQGDLSDLFVSQVPKGRNLRERLQASEEKGLLRILAAPVLMGKSDEELAFTSGMQVPVSTIANFTITTRFVNAAVELRTTARIESGMVKLHIELQRNFPRWELIPEETLSSSPNAGRNVPLNTQSVQMIAKVRDGGTVVIGGIYELTRLDNKMQRGPELILFITAKDVTI